MPKQSLSYEFEGVGHGDEDGFNDPVRTQFDTNISRVVAREAIQNILDAAVKNPAIVKFDLLSENLDVIPDVQTLKKIILACKKHYPDNKDAAEHFDLALKILSGKKINILRVSDYNTKGLGGDDKDKGGDYYCFLKSVGASAKSQEEGGSFGLGKGSFYAASALNTIFVSSIWDDKKSPVFQGKLRLVSHEQEGRVRRGSGSYGLKEEKPVRSTDLIPEFFRRKKRGTDIFIPGYKDTSDWHVHMIKSIISNFWYALVKGNLEAHVGDLQITKKNIKEQAEKYFDLNVQTNDDESNPLTYINCYLNSEPIEEELPTLGKVRLYLIQRSHYPKRVACFRKTGMLIQEKRFNCTLPYAGVFVCENNEGNSILRKMESPNHDKWDKNSAHSKKNGEPLEEVVRADREYKEFIKKSLRDLVGGEEQKEISIGGLEKYLHLPTREDSNVESDGIDPGPDKKSDKESSVEVGIDYEKTVVVSPQDKNIVLGKINTHTETSVPDPGGEYTGPGGTDEGGGHGGGGGDRPSEGGGQPVTPDGGSLPGRKKLDLKSRSFATKASSGKFEHFLILREGKPKSKCAVSLFVGTDDYFEKIKITEAKYSDGKPCGEIGTQNEIKGVLLDKNGEAKIKLLFEGNERYSLNTVVYEDK